MIEKLMIFTFGNQFFSRLGRDIFRLRILRFLPWFVLTASLLVTYQIWRNAQNETKLTLQTEFNYNILEASYIVEQHMQIYEELLRGVQGLFAASISVERNEFRDYVDALNIQINYPGIQSLSFTLLIPRDKKEKHIAAMRREGYSNYAIRPDGIRDIYSSELYLEPFTGRNMHAFGYDNFADPVRRAAMERVRDTGLCIISPKIKLEQEINTPVQAGFQMWLPIYKNGLPHNTLAERRNNFIGWVGASFRMDDLMFSIFDNLKNTLNVEIHDGEEISNDTLMYKADKRTDKNRLAEPYFRSVKLLNFAEHHWSMVFTSLPDFDKRLHDQNPRLIVYAGVIVSILLSLITGLLVYGRTLALKAAQALDRELKERKRAEAGLRLTEKVFETVDVAVLVTDKKNQIIKVNPAFTSITGYSAEEALGRTTGVLSSGAHPPEFYKEMWDALSSTGSWQGEIYNRRKNGEFYTEWLSINEVRDNEGKLTNYVALFSDISERKAEEAQMVNLAHYDPLTGLPNRTLLADRLQQAISSAKREKEHMAMMFVDLDKFKPINDTLGHHIGDLVLKEVAKRILGCLRESDTAARIGGDEFVVLLPAIEHVADALAVGEKIRQALFQPFNLAGHEMNISSSIGVAVYPEHGTDEKSLLGNADTAMYNAKDSGRNAVILFAPDMKKKK